jgi:GT2 family glycosyltransferase
MIKIYAILTSHNRKESTLECLRRLEGAAELAKVNLKAILVDDGSTDGTAVAVERNFDWVKVIRGDGSLFWNKGMHLGFSEAIRQGADAYLWVNDDTHIVDNALQHVINTWQMLEQTTGKPVVVSGATADETTGEITYGGDVAQSKLKRFTYQKVWDENIPLRCDVAQGNFLLIPKKIAQAVGNLDPVFEHAMGDTDYTLRVRQAGYSAYVASGVIGYCTKNPVKGTFNDTSLSLSQRWKAIMSRKGLPPKSWLHFTRRHGGLIWPLYFVWPYFRVVIDAFISLKIYLKSIKN